MSLALSGAVLGAPLVLLRSGGPGSASPSRLVSATGGGHAGRKGRPAPGPGSAGQGEPGADVPAPPVVPASTVPASPTEPPTTLPEPSTAVSIPVGTPTSSALAAVRQVPAPPPTPTSTAPVRRAAPSTAPPTTAPAPKAAANQETGPVSWYDITTGTCASQTIAMGTVVTVTDLSNGASTTCLVEDRGPFVGGRILDLAEATFAQLADPSVGVIQAQIQW